MNDAHAPQLHQMQNGITLCIHRIDGVASVATHMLLPAGCAHDSDAQDGIAPMLAEYALRGTAHLSSRALSDALDCSGIHRGVSAGTQHLHLHGTTTAARAHATIDHFACIVQSPRMDQVDLEPIRSLCQQSLASLEDDPQEEALLHVLHQHRPRPLHRTGLGTPEALATLSIDTLRAAWKDRMQPRGAVIAIAGHIDPDDIIQHVEQQFGDWTGPPGAPMSLEPGPCGRTYIERPSQQVHLALAINAPTAADDAYEATRLAVWVLGGGSSSRLFLDVRQRRGLCYGIGARWGGGTHDGFIQITTGTTPDRVRETLDTTLNTLVSTATDITLEEIDRAKLQFRSGMVRSGESTRARAAAMARDAIVLGRVRSLPERIAAMEVLEPEAVMAAAAPWADATPTIVGVGPADACPWA
ncbi:MAG: insulinase family protein [Phycisphaerales bacterium]|nr:insulinase family protein [Phycisphaerales bacterium]